MSDYRGSEAVIPERQLKALRLRQAGATYRAIGDNLGISHVTAWQDVKNILKLMREETVEEVQRIKELELQRLDTALQAIYPQILKGNNKSIEVMLKIQDRRAKLQGLDEPTKSAVTHELPEPIRFILRDKEPNNNE